MLIVFKDLERLSYTDSNPIFRFMCSVVVISGDQFHVPAVKASPVRDRRLYQNIYASVYVAGLQEHATTSA